MSDPIVHTPDGRLAGVALGEVRAFLGVPYAAPPVGALRLRSPVPVTPWPRIRSATQYGPACPQHLAGNQTWLNPPLVAMAESCLTLNVWSPAKPGPWPVLVWLHGGQTRHGSGNGPATDGAALAARGLVVVTVNYRLGALGGLAHPALRDPATGWCANWGLQDKLAALAWVSRSIADFGGDRGCVTLAGQSSGAANAALIAQNGLAQGQFHRLILHSPPLFRPPMFAELDAAAAYTQAFADALGLAVTALPSQDGPSLQAAEHRFAQSPDVRTRLGRPHTAPVRDGALIRQWSYDAPPPAVPMMAGWTRTEADFWFDLRDATGATLSPMTAPQEASARQAAVTRLMAQHHAFRDPIDVQNVLQAYARADDPGSAWRDIYTDLVFRGPILHLLGRHARQTPAAARTWGFAFGHPVCQPVGSVPHACDVPLVFGTHNHPWFAGKISAGASAVSDAVMQAWVSMARDGNPGEDWQAFDPDRPVVKPLGGQGTGDEEKALSRPESAKRLACWPGYQASQGESAA